MAEEAAAEAKAEPKKKGKLLLIVLIILIAVAGAAAFMWLRFGAASKANKPDATEVSAKEHGDENKDAKDGAGTVYNLDPFIVNLQDNSGTRYLKLTINLELAPSSSTAELAAKTAKIRDALIVLLSSKSYADIGTVEGKYQLRDEIVARVNQFLVKSHVKTAYFTDFVVQ